MQASQLEIARERDPASSEADRLHRHLRKSLADQPTAIVDHAIESANEAFEGGTRHMQTALDAGVASANALRILVNRADAICEAHAKELDGDDRALTHEHFDLLREALADFRGVA